MAELLKAARFLIPGTVFVYTLCNATREAAGDTVKEVGRVVLDTAKAGIVIEQVATFPDNGRKIQEVIIVYTRQSSSPPATSNSWTAHYDINRWQFAINSLESSLPLPPPPPPRAYVLNFGIFCMESKKKMKYVREARWEIDCSDKRCRRGNVSYRSYTRIRRYKE